MKKRYIVPFLMMAFMAIVAVPVHAESDAVKHVDITVTEEERYKEEYYGEPAFRYAPERARTFSRTAELSFEEYLVAALENLETTIDVSNYNISAENVEEVGREYNKLLNSNPQLFYIKRSSFTSSGGKIIAFNIEYIADNDTIQGMIGEFETAADLAAAQVDKSLSDYQQALIVHDYLALNCEYDYESYLNNAVPDISHTAYGSLVNQVAVCDGYADAFAYIMEDKLGISCEVISSDAMHHAWNMIEIEEEWYHVDVTWDDPAYDRIGRVLHENFLCSDSKISKDSPNAETEENHYSWSSTYTADSSVYDAAFWGKIRSAICYHNDAWYYAKYQIENNDASKGVKLMKKSKDKLLDDEENVLFETSVWREGSSYYSTSYMYLVEADNNIYFNTQDKIYKLNSDESETEIYSPQDAAGKMIVGFTVRGNELWYVPQDDPNSSSKQVIHKYALAQVEGISAENVTGTYNGNPYTIEVVGAQDGDTIEYADEDGNYQSTQPEMIDAGIYEVSYRVSREGYISFRGMATVTIEKATPQYETPTNLNGNAGSTLATVTLPEGFTWQTDAQTVLEEIGTVQYLVKYTPEDTRNYKSVSNIEVMVEVTCPGHQYISQITTQPTAEQNGVETFTCTLCGHTYTSEIDRTLPTIEDISVEDVEGTYNGEEFTIEIQGMLDGDVIQYALEGEAYTEEMPKFQTAGTYEVLYRIERTGYQPLYGTVTVEITKAVPTYTVPTGCAGNSGDALSTVTLPEGFVWQDGDTVLREEGEHNYPANYTPEDTDNYQTVRVAVPVEVTCPGHQYESEITKEPTDTEEGELTYTCTLCGNSYTESTGRLLPAITGITVSDVSGTYNGRPYRIQVKGTKAGDIVTYALKQVSSDDVGYTEEQPVMQNAGTYTVLYRVERTGCRPYTGSVTVEIARATPSYTLPMNLSGVSGAQLSSVELPEGFLWQTDPKTKLSREGYQKFYVCYRPEDQVNYAVVTNIEISIKVECPGHQYESVITKAATETEKGIRTYTCKLCSKIYTEEIAMLAPIRPGSVSELIVTGNTTNALSFSWKAEEGVGYRLVFYEGKNVVSTKYITGNTFTYTGLRSATIYTLQVTPYRIVNGNSVYARAAQSVKAATIPVKANLKAAKRKGKNKVRLNWRSVDGASGYEIFMKTGNGSYKKIKTVGKGSTVSFTKSRLSRKKAYSFKIRAYIKVDGNKVYGAYSNVKKVKKQR